MTFVSPGCSCSNPTFINAADLAAAEAEVKSLSARIEECEARGHHHPRLWAERRRALRTCNLYRDALAKRGELP